MRPYLSKDFRKIAFNSFHGLSHPGIRATRKMVSKKLFWPGMNTDIGPWAKACIQCQRSKANRHVISELGKFPEVSGFEHIQMQISLVHCQHLRRDIGI